MKSLMIISVAVGLSALAAIANPDEEENRTPRLIKEQLKKFEYIRVYRVREREHDLLYYYRKDGIYSDTNKWRAFKDATFNHADYYVVARSGRGVVAGELESTWSKAVENSEQMLDFRVEFRAVCTVAELGLWLQEIIVHQRSLLGAPSDRHDENQEGACKRGHRQEGS